MNGRRQFAGPLASVYLLYFGFIEGFDHKEIIWCAALNVKRYIR
jgi:hypothetical protein